MVYDIPNRICPHRNFTICKSADGKFKPDGNRTDTVYTDSNRTDADVADSQTANGKVG